MLLCSSTVRSLRNILVLGHVHIYDRPKRAGKRCKHEIAVGELVISSGDTAKMFDAIEEALDQVARTVQPTVVAALCLAIRTRRDDNLRTGSPNLLHEGVGVVALVCDNRSCAQMFNQLCRTRDVGDLPFSDDQSQRTTRRVDCQMQLGAQSASGTTERLRPVFFEAPAECWCARTIVESIRTCSISVWPASAFTTRCHTACLRQREKRMYTVCHRPHSTGKSRHRLPVRAIHSTASRHQRLLRAVRPRSPSLPGRMSRTLFHTSSLSNVRAIPSHSAKDRM